MKKAMLLSSIFCVVEIFMAVWLFADSTFELRDKAKKLLKDGNYADALVIYKELLSGKLENTNPEEDFSMALRCYDNLNRAEEREEFREEVLKIFKDNWRLLWRVAKSFSMENYWGALIDGKFIRGRGDNRRGKFVNSFKRDMTRAFQLYAEAYAKSSRKDNSDESGYNLIIDFADFIMRMNGNESWRLQELTDLSTLPDYEEQEKDYWGGYRGGGGTRGAPVDNEGAPIFYSVPANFADAKSDGERWRYLLHEASELSPSWRVYADKLYADFLHSQFGVQTLVGFSLYGDDGGDEDATADANPYAVHTLGEDETIAKLATGIKRFKLPDEHNYIKILRSISNGKDQPADLAINELANIFKNRRQYTKAVECLRDGVNKFGAKHYGYADQIDSIIGDCGEFMPSLGFPAGRNPSLRIRYRNAKIASFEAFELKAEQIISDVKEYIKSNPKELKWEKLDLNDIGRRIVLQNEGKYIGAKITDWKLELNPKKGHWDRVQNIEVPFSKAGAYLVTAKFGEGNISRITLWLNDAVIIRKPGDNTQLYYCADAFTGKPLAAALVEFFGYSFEAIEQNLWKSFGRHYNIKFHSFEAKTNADGISVLPASSVKEGNSWLVTLKTPSGHFSYIGFDGIWFMKGRPDEIFDNRKTYTITDRPVYRPGQEVKFKIWLGRARYENLSEERSEYAGHQVNVKVMDSFNEKVFEETISADQWGGIDGKFMLKKDCHLGVYIIQIDSGRLYGTGAFRVEEYKKPEFEVTIDKPSEPVTLGDKITAKVKAKYYFGAPVTNAKVKYKVERYQHDDQWFFPCRWDWLYGKGYWWQLPNYEWYPGWDSWACYAPRDWWIPYNPLPPELVMENEVTISEDGTVDIVIDSSVAKAIYGNRDQRYEITAEVVDASRRTIFGKGSCIAAAKPFKVNAWTDAGWANPGHTIIANFAVRTADGEGVAGEGTLSLLKIKYDRNGIPREELLQSWNLKTDEEGFANIKIKAGAKGQYRLSYAFEAKGAKGEGACIFSVFGDDIDDGEYRFNAIEIISREREYSVGNKALLRINTEKKDSTVLLFIRPQNGIYTLPVMLSLKNGTTEYEIPISKADIPNFFVEALTIANGKIYSIKKEIIVPPERCALDVEIIPSKTKYKPGEKSHATIKITDAKGNPWSNSSVVVSIYDKALEYISGGSNVPEIKEFFWKWRRTHYSRTESSVDKIFYNILKEKERGLERLGIFADIGLGDEIEVDERLNKVKRLGVATRYKYGAKLANLSITPGILALGDDVPAPNTVEASMVIAGNDSDAPSEGEGFAGKNAPQVVVRTNFADTALWVANLATNERGEALVELDMPENLTTWKVKAWTMASGTRVGEGETEIISSKDFILRMQSPRFFVEKDKATLSAIVHNYHQSQKNTSVSLELDGDCLAILDGNDNSRIRNVEIAAGGETRVDWKVAAVAEGEALVRMKAITDDDSDSMEMKFPVYVHGMRKTVSFASSLSPDESQRFTVMKVPIERREDDSVLQIRYSPSLAIALLDALPYMCEYPYGCTEQTLNKFVPLVIVRKMLVNMGLNLEDIAKKRVNFDSQQIGESPANFAVKHHKGPTFDTAKFNDMLSTGLKRLEAMQLSDGGWGWFSGYGECSYPHTTAIVVHGLLTAKNNDVEVNTNIIKRGLDWLERYQSGELKRLCKHHFEAGETCKEKHPDNYKSRADETDALVYMVLAEGGISNQEMTRILFRDRNELRVYAKILYALGLHLNKESEKLKMLKRNISQNLVFDDENQTAYLDLGKANWWWCWHGSEIEANAFYLKLLTETEPKSDISPRLVKYLLNNRKYATYWNSTRDTAYCIEAMTDFIKASGENMPNMELEIFFDGKLLKKQKITAENLFLIDNAVTLKGKELGSGEHKLEFRKTGTGALYYSAYLNYFTLEDFIEKTGLEIKVERRYYKLVRAEKQISAADKRGQVVKQNLEKYERIPLQNFDTLKSGDLVEIELVVESKNDYEYLVFEDMKPAGLEPCEIRSGYNGNEMRAFVEFRDERVLFFVRTLARGKHSVSYRMKAEIPGSFSALPTRGSAMYAPELKANSNEIKISVEDN